MSQSLASTVPALPADLPHYVLLGDEHDIAAIAQLLAALPEDCVAQVFIEIEDEDQRQPLPSAAQVQVAWLERNGFDADSSTLLEDTLRDFEIPDEDAGYWVGAATTRAEAIAPFIVEYLDAPAEWVVRAAR